MKLYLVEAIAPEQYQKLREAGFPLSELNKLSRENLLRLIEMMKTTLATLLTTQYTLKKKYGETAPVQTPSQLHTSQEWPKETEAEAVPEVETPKTIPTRTEAPKPAITPTAASPKESLTLIGRARFKKHAGITVDKAIEFLTKLKSSEGKDQKKLALELLNILKMNKTHGSN